MRTIELTKFCLRQWGSGFQGTQIETLSPSVLMVMANMAQDTALADGYAPFCKHLFIRSHGATRAGVAAITSRNEEFLCSGYKARREGELPVLSRWFEGVEAPRAEWLDLILYSREQLLLEGDDVPDADWGIVAINGELFPRETPMLPATMLRNALGVSEGGSGVPLSRGAYAESVAFWEKHALVG